MGNWVSSAGSDKPWPTLRKPTARNSFTSPANRLRVVFVVGEESSARKRTLMRLRRSRRSLVLKTSRLLGFYSSMPPVDLALLLRKALLESDSDLCFMYTYP